MDFGQALIKLSEGLRLRRKAWGAIYYVYIDSRYPTKFSFVYDKPFFTDEDLLMQDWLVLE